MPPFSEETHYVNDGHDGNSLNGAYDSRDLNNDISFTSGARDFYGISTVVARSSSGVSVNSLKKI
ncbi:hypothetical protein SAMN02745181_2937 [Rubritalea squalenifaciens DSM 18772]|uniref:Uncharacterized protein n=1 Tax=Rubritalea squalenifaciens DSM 18772 TaxID=1123071 RepID=A0A1M6NR70_9BACT|nr:hypothetical protein [Rubritalea squalenifaciens]SHJ98126.1 hypothetical protein SAMN02745181_2937 [Rubritalea squalenifaciens DSM 18772]